MLVGAVRAVRRRTPLLRRRYAGRYVPGGDLAELAVVTPVVGNLIADAVRLRDRIAGSRACREQWLAGCIDDYDLDAAVWQLTQTGLATAATMDAVCTAADTRGCARRPSPAGTTSRPLSVASAPTWPG